MNDILEMAQGNLTRVIAVRLRPGTDVLQGLTEACRLHVHMSLSDRYGNAHGGHLVEGTKVLLTVDVIIAEIGGLVMGRKFDDELEVPLFAPKQA